MPGEYLKSGPDHHMSRCSACGADLCAALCREGMPIFPAAMPAGDLSQVIIALVLQYPKPYKAKDMNNSVGLGN
jgi:hypothetical protein